LRKYQEENLGEKKEEENGQKKQEKRRRKLQQAPLSPYLSDSSLHNKINPSTAPFSLLTDQPFSSIFIHRPDLSLPLAKTTKPSLPITDQTNSPSYLLTPIARLITITHRPTQTQHSP